MREAAATALSESTDVRRRYFGGLAALEIHFKLSDRVSILLGLRTAATGPRLRFTYQDILSQERTLFRPSLWMIWGQSGVALRF